MVLQTFGGSSGVAAAGSYQGQFAVDLRRKNCFWVTISDQVFFAFLALRFRQCQNGFESQCQPSAKTYLQPE